MTARLLSVRLPTTPRHILPRLLNRSKGQRPFVKAILQTAAKLDKATQSEQLDSFVKSFRQASPYIVEHANSVFIVVIPGEVIAAGEKFDALLADLYLVHSLGVQLVVVIGTQNLIDDHLGKARLESKFHGRQRITDEATLEAAIHAASEVRMKIEGFFSKVPAMGLMRRHGVKSNSPGIKVISGNFTAAKAKGIIDGVNFGRTGDVRAMAALKIQELLQQRNIVLINNLGYSAAGDVLNCDSRDIGLYAAVELKADKLICMYADDIREQNLPTWLPLDRALELLSLDEQSTHQNDASPSPVTNNELQSIGSQLVSDLGHCDHLDLPDALVVSILSCRYGVRRSHLVDAEVDGGLLLELYTRDGVGTMISSDFHEGIRKATVADMIHVLHLLEPLVKNGTLVRRSYEQLLIDVDNYRVFEKEGRIWGCISVSILDEQHRIAEIASLAVHPNIRKRGKGDALLTYVEEELMQREVRRLVILTTRTADWFVQRGFAAGGSAHESELLPEHRLAKLDSHRNSQIYVKTLGD